MKSVSRVTSILVVSLLPCMLPLCAAFTFTPGAFHARSLQKVIVRRVSIDTVSEQNEERDTDDSPNAPLFDIEAIDEKASTYQVKDVSSQQTEVDYTLTYDDDSDDEDLYGGADDEDIFNQNVDQYRKDFIDVDAEAMGGSEFIRDDDDLLTERESRLYVNESGQAVEREKCILVGVEDLSAKYKDRKMAMSKNPEEWEVYFNLEQSMDEMRELIDTSGMDLAGEMIQRMNDVNPRTYIGTGKVQECQQLMDELGSCTVIFDAELSPGQQKALENAFNKEVIQNDFLGSEQLVSMR